MNKHSLIKTAFGVGLMAVSFASSASGLHSFRQPMMYYRLDGSVVRYVAFVPAQPIGAPFPDNVVELDLYASGTSSTWHYALNNDNKGTDARGADSDQMSVGGDTTVTVGVPSGYLAPNAPSVEMSMDTNNPFGLGVTATLSLPFTQTSTVSSVACKLQYVASINSVDVLKFENMTVRPTSWPVASSDVSYGGGGTIASTDWNGYNFTASSTFPTATNPFTIQTGAAASNTSTYARSDITKANVCVGAYTAKNAMNAANGMIGGQNGLMRLW